MALATSNVNGGNSALVLSRKRDACPQKIAYDPIIAKCGSNVDRGVALLVLLGWGRSLDEADRLQLPRGRLE